MQVFLRRGAAAAAARGARRRGAAARRAAPPRGACEGAACPFGTPRAATMEPVQKDLGAKSTLNTLETGVMVAHHNPSGFPFGQLRVQHGAEVKILERLVTNWWRVEVRIIEY